MTDPQRLSDEEQAVQVLEQAGLRNALIAAGWPKEGNSITRHLREIAQAVLSTARQPQSKAAQSGQRARAAGIGLAQNPFKDEPHYREWAEGWLSTARQSRWKNNESITLQRDGSVVREQIGD